MKRSQVNEILLHADEMIRCCGLTLSPIAYWTPEEFKAKANIAHHIIDARCGWDITNYDDGNFEKMGLFLFTLRNGFMSDCTD